jgi:type IV pilus assembly protein PilB
MAQTMRRDIGELLVQGRVITNDQLAQAREASGKTGKDLESVLVSDFAVKPFNILQAKAHIAGLRAVDLSKNPPEAGAINLITPQVAQRHKCVPITRRTENGRDVIYVAMADASNIMALDDIQASSKLKPIAVLALPEQIDQLISQHYAAVVPAQDSGNNGQSTPATAHEENVDFAGMIKEYGGTEAAADEMSAASMEDEAVQGPIIRIAHAIIQEAVKAGASDIHVEPSARNVRVRYRIDGVLH